MQPQKEPKSLSVVSPSDSVLVLYQSYPAEPGLNSYLKRAIEDGILPLPVYVSTFLEASAAYILSSDILTLDFLCALPVKLHEDSGHLPLGSLVPSIEDPLATLVKVERCLRLLRLAGTSQAQSARQQNLLVNSGKLLMHLLSCVNDISGLPIQEAYHLWDQANTLMMGGVGLSENLRGSLSSFAWSLNLHLSSDETVGKEAQMMQNMQMAKGDIGGPNSENDIITLGLLLQYLVRLFNFTTVPLLLSRLSYSQSRLSLLLSSHTGDTKGTGVRSWKYSTCRSAPCEQLEMVVLACARLLRPGIRVGLQLSRV